MSFFAHYKMLSEAPEMNNERKNLSQRNSNNGKIKINFLETSIMTLVASYKIPGYKKFIRFNVFFKFKKIKIYQTIKN